MTLQFGKQITFLYLHFSSRLIQLGKWMRIFRLRRGRQRPACFWHDAFDGCMRRETGRGREGAV